MTVEQFDPELLRSLRARIQAKHRELSAGPAGSGLVPLKISCVMASCKHDRHSLDYLRKPHVGQRIVKRGTCRDCGRAVVEIPSAADRDYESLSLLARTCEDQQNELIRAHYWNVPIDQWAYNQALRLGRRELLLRLRKRVCNAIMSRNVWSGREASYSKDILSYAQHATATCCRKCAAYWHGVSRDVNDDVTGAQMDYVVRAAQTWIDVRLPNLADDGVRVPSIREASLPHGATVDAMDDLLMDHFGSGVDPVGLMQVTGSHIQVRGERKQLVLQRSLALMV